MNRRAGATTAEDTEEERGASAAEQRQQSPTDLCEMMTDGASAFASLRGWSLPFAPPGAASPSHALPSGRPALCERQHCIRKRQQVRGWAPPPLSACTAARRRPLAACRAAPGSVAAVLPSHGKSDRQAAEKRVQPLSRRGRG
ncbi:unnamed protein product [Prorocentrum cordatum]|uniref:Uncharacterized protein n=1 Tax=Prorocentrum cordatum TaxID=2364126 RepID=A0ABN9WTH3_9DINO|nr:unnamed protein product [Polarella glacialis]